MLTQPGLSIESCLKTSNLWLKFLYHWKKWRASLASAQRVKEAPLFIATIIKNERPYLKEWIDFHLAQGVRRIYIADNGSKDDPISVLLPYMESGKVYFQRTRSKAWSIRLQALELNRLLSNISLAEGKHAWVAVIDIDEYLWHTEGRKLISFLQDFKNQKIASISVNWLMFGTNGVKHLDTGKPMLEQLTMRAHVSLGEHKMVKPILYLRNTAGFLEGPHYAFAKGDAQDIYSDGSPYLPQEPKIVHQPLCLNHYWYRDEAYYNSEKRAKRLAFGDERSGKRESDHIRACNYEEDRRILEKGPFTSNSN